MKSNGMLKIEKGIEINRSSRYGRPNIYPFHAMKVGDSFFVPSNGKSAQQIYNRLNSSIAYAQTKYEVKFARRKRTKKMDGEDGVRIWRVE